MKLLRSLRIIRTALMALTVYGCVDYIVFKVPDPSQILVVDGLITDEPGPYSVKLHFASNVNYYLGYAVPAPGAIVVIFDDAGNSETLRDLGNGTYETKPSGIQGQVGRQYHIEIQTTDGKKYQSQPELLSPVGTLDSLYFEFQHQQQIVGTEAITTDGFYVYLDATGLPNQKNLLRWSWKGTYKLFTHPELYVDPLTHCDAPLPCSGYIAPTCHTIKKVSDLCTCCTCWANQHQISPVVSDDQFFANGKISRINVAFIPSNQTGFDAVNSLNFYDKNYIEVEQFSLTENSYEFWKLTSIQKTSAASLFQPPSSKVRGNVYSIDGQQEVLGIFSASSVVRKSIYIHKSDIPRQYFGPDEIYAYSCEAYDTSSTPIQPSFWINN